MSKYSNKVFAVFLAVLFLFSSVNVNIMHVHGEEDNTDSNWQTCDVYEGSNINGQNYDRWTSTIKSYLTVTSDGNLMKLQALSNGQVVIEYYTSSYKLLPDKTVILKDDLLSIFGGFYETDENYFIVSGQTNENQDSSVEVFRISKYDKNWNLIKSAGLKDCNTTVPFDAGTVRMDSYGDYLLIRTSHEMYKYSDGLNHQANVTIQVKIPDMSITDSFTKIMNSNYGYVSHSFNQFIKIDENGHIVAVDHGDAGPRSMVLIQYPTNVSDESFTSSRCSVTNVFNFAGNKGNNTTGASIGGFELASNNYLIAGNSVEQDANFSSRTTRNIYVWAVDKTTKGVKSNQITNYTEGDGTTSTPHLVKINDNRFILMWSRNGLIYYAEIDGSGNINGEIHNISGNLSDCMPVVNNNKLVWYTWKNENINFYEINLNNLDDTNIKEITNGHDYQATGKVNSQGTIEVKCSHCGDIKDVTYFNSMDIFWNSQESGLYYETGKTNLDVNEKSYCWIQPNPLPSDDKPEIIVANPEIISWTSTSNDDTKGYFTALNPGTTTVTIKSKFNSSLKEEFTFTVNGPLTISSFTADKDNQEVNSTVTLTAKAFGGTNNYTYKFYQESLARSETVIYEGNESSCTWTPTVAGNTRLWVAVNDGNTTVTKSLDYNVSKLTLDKDDFTYQAPSNLTYDGKEKKASVKFKGDLAGLGTITLKYYNSNGNLINGLPTNVGKYTVKIDVSEGTNNKSVSNITDSSWTFEITKANLSNVPNSEINVNHDKNITKVGDVALAKDWTWKDPDIELLVGGKTQAVAIYNGSDKQNYNNTEMTITIVTSSHKGGTATCTKLANCEVCGKEYGSKNSENHEKKTTINQREASCTENGYTGDVICEECKEVLIKGKEIEKIDHDYEVVKKVSSEYECGGYLVTYECSRCHDSYQKTEGAGHVYSDEYKIDVKATCQKEGSKSRHCIYECGAKTDEQVIPKLEHVFTNYVSNNDATCIADGTMSAKCENCDEINTITEKGSMLPHQGGVATCTKLAVCKKCGKEYGNLDPNNHVEKITVNKKEVSCTEDGYTGDIICKACKKVLTAGEVIKSTGHAYKEIERAPSKYECGGYFVTYECNKCHDSYQEIEGAKHVYSDKYEIDVKATCQNDGSKSRHCIYECGAKTDVQVIPKLEHVFTNYVSNNDATCTADGTMSAKCENCDEINTITEKGSMLPHQGGVATCTKLAVCEKCGKEYGNLDPNNHDEKVTVNQKDASCIEDGYTGDVICNACKKELTAGEVIESTGHHFENGVCTTCGANQSGTVTPIDPDSPQKPNNTVNNGNISSTKDKPASAVATGDDAPLFMHASIVVSMIGLAGLVAIYRKKYLMK